MDKPETRPLAGMCTPSIRLAFCIHHTDPGPQNAERSTASGLGVTYTGTLQIPHLQVKHRVINVFLLYAAYCALYHADISDISVARFFNVF